MKQQFNLPVRRVSVLFSSVQKLNGPNEFWQKDKRNLFLAFFLSVLPCWKYKKAAWWASCSVIIDLLLQGKEDANKYRGNLNFWGITKGKTQSESRTTTAHLYQKSNVTEPNTMAPAIYGDVTVNPKRKGKVKKCLSIWTKWKWISWFLWSIWSNSFNEEFWSKIGPKDSDHIVKWVRIAWPVCQQFWQFWHPWVGKNLVKSQGPLCLKLLGTAHLESNKLGEFLSLSN